MSVGRSSDFDLDHEAASRSKGGDGAAGVGAVMELPHFPVHIPVPDISPWLAGNTGIPGFTTRDSGRPGPHVVLVCLTHGNEIAGAIVLDRMLRSGMRPVVG